MPLAEPRRFVRTCATAIVGILRILGAPAARVLGLIVGHAAVSETLAPGATASIAAQTPVVVAAKIQLTPLETLAVSVAAQAAAAQQTSLAPLFANLGVAAGLDGLPPQIQQAAALVLSQRTGLDPNLTGDDIKQAFRNSGLFLEASLASGSVSASGPTPDLKAALIVLRQVLTTSLDGVTATPGAPATQSALATQSAGHSRNNLPT